MDKFNSRVTISYLREMLNAAAMQSEAVGQSGSIDNAALARMRLSAVTLGLLQGLTGDEVQASVDAANERAKMMFTNGEDWRRELRLYDTLVNYLKIKL